ncbi:hypothetical protein Tco_0518975 [Tanacetum coccineum]
MVKLTTFAMMCKAYRGENKLDKKSFKDKVPLHLEMDPLYDQIATYPSIVRTFPDHILYPAGLKTTWKHSPKKPVIYHRGQEINFKSFMLGGVDGELNFLPAEGASEGQNSPSGKYVNNNAPMIDATPLSSIYPSNVVENVADSDDPSYGEDEQTLIVQKVPARASKVVGEASTPLDVDSVSDIHEFSSAKELKDATDFHWVIAHDRGYAELERTCNEAFQDLDKNPLVSDIHADIKALHGQVDGLHSEYSRLILEEKKWVDYEQTVFLFRPIIRRH